MKGLATFSLLTLLWTSEALAETWLCISDQSTGFIFKSGRWEHVFFSSNDKYVLRSIKASDKGSIALAVQPNSTHIFSEVGERQPAIGCVADKQSESDAGFIRCEGPGTFVLFNKKSLRFQIFYSIGYVIPDPESEFGMETQRGNTPSLTIGKCSPIG